MYPTLLEFAVECTYPNDEAVLTAIIMVSSCVQGLAMVQLDDVLSPSLQDHLQAMVAPHFVFVRLQTQSCSEHNTLFPRLLVRRKRELWLATTTFLWPF